jgi:hypothetical protein
MMYFIITFICVFLFLMISLVINTKSTRTKIVKAYHMEIEPMKVMSNNLIKLILLILIILSSYLSKGKEINITKVFYSTLEQRDTCLVITLNNPYITIGDIKYISTSRNIYSPEDEYTIYDEFTIKNGKITFQYDPDTGYILTVKFEEFKTFYYRP